MTDVSRLNWWEREKLLTPRDREAVSRAQSSSWEDIDENWAETDAGRYEVHVICTRKYHKAEAAAGML